MTNNKLAVQETKPLVTKKSESEIWLINPHGDKLYRICGIQRKDMPLGFVCINRAGYKTAHVGQGLCNKHDLRLTNPKNVGAWAKLNEKAGLPQNLLGYLEHTAKLEDTFLAQVDEDIKGLYALILYLMNRRKKEPEKGEGKEEPEEGFLVTTDIDLILKITDKIFKAKDLRLKLNKELTLDMTTISAFVDQMFKVIMANTGEKVGKVLLDTILKEVILPFKEQGKIKGDGLIFDAKTKELWKEIEKSEEI